MKKNILFLMLLSSIAQAEVCLPDLKYQRVPGIYSVQIQFPGQIMEDVLVIEKACGPRPQGGVMTGSFTIPGVFTTKFVTRIIGGVGMNVMRSQIHFSVKENGGEIPVVLSIVLEDIGVLGALIFTQTGEKFPVLLKKLK